MCSQITMFSPQVSITSTSRSSLGSFCNGRWRLALSPRQPSRNLPCTRIKIDCLHGGRVFIECRVKVSSVWGENSKKNAVLARNGRRGRLLVVVRANGGFGGGGGDGWDKGTNSRVLGNLALAIGLTYLTMTGQLGWVLDAIVSIWLLAVILPIVGIGAFFWFAGRDIVQSNCPNCGNEFQILKSAMKDGPQLCPFCSQPFSVQDDKFVRESARFSSNRSATYGNVFNGFSPRVDKGKASSSSVVDIEAEVKDAD